MSQFPLSTKPLAESYKEQYIDNVLRTQMEYGIIKTRKLAIKARKIISIQFIINRSEYEEFVNWYNETIASGSQSFTMQEPITDEIKTYRFYEHFTVSGFDKFIKLNCILEEIV